MLLVESAAAVGLYCRHSALVRYFSERRIVICDVFDIVYICSDSKVLREYCPLTFTQAWLRTTPIFYTATDTMTDLFNIDHVGNRQQDPRSCLVHPVDLFDSEGDSAVTRWYFNVFLVKSMQHLSENTQFSSFLFSQVVQRHKLDEVGK